ncbi:beta-lactamase/transpeptidase-like protein [Coniochaeta sp. PMI_546]|nr:beta-lactamase/transpeptidase-like protein [Coniochaeta sp. PMI_546]
MNALQNFEVVIDQAIRDGAIPGVVLFARDKSGKLDYLHAAGQSSLSPPHPMTPSTIFTLASVSKLLTTIALLQLVERNLLTLDEDIAPHLPDLAAQPVLSATTNLPIPRTRPITPRNLLTHTSGLTYPFLSPALAAIKSSTTGSPDPFFGPTLAKRYTYPLLSQPSTAFQVGPGLDFAGALIEALTGVDLDTYFGQHILAPLGIRHEDMTFFPHRVAGLVDSPRFARVCVRDPATGELGQDEATGSRGYLGSEEAFGGEGVYASVEAYGEVLTSLLRGDGRLLMPETVSGVGMFEPQLSRFGAGVKGGLLRRLEDPGWVVGTVPPTGEYDWGLGGLVVDGDGHGWRRRGMMFWGGMFNMVWFIDREAGVCGVFGTQVLPVRDLLVNRLHEQFEEAVYKTVGGFEGTG